MAESKDNLIHDEISDKIISIAEDFVKNEGVRKVTVSKILKKLDVTNRVFYNRFHNIDEVMKIIYDKSVLEMHESVKSDLKIEDDFFEYALDISVNVLLRSYEVKQQFSQYMFEHDSYTDDNFNWWTAKISEIINYGKAHGYIENVDTEILSYSIWCFYRGFNADAVNRRLSEEEAVKRFRYGLKILFDGIRKQ